MQFNETTPRAARTIAGQVVQVIQPFAEGDVLTPATAAMLNQTLAENFSNNLRTAVQEAAEAKATEAAIQTIVDEYMARYEPGVRTGGGGRTADPVEREAKKIARSKVLELLKKKGIKQADVNVGELVDALFEKNREVLLKEGAKIVKMQEKATDDMDFDIGIGG